MAKKEEIIEKEIITRKIITAKSPKKKKTPSKKKKTSTPRKKSETKEIEKALVQNFTSLQKVMTQLSENFNSLGKRIDQLLNLFEDSAKAIVKKDFVVDKEREMNLSVLSKMDELLEQNKVIAKSLVMFYEVPKEKVKKEEEFIPPKPIEELHQKSLLSTQKEEIKSPNKRQEELGTKNPFVKEDVEGDWGKEFDMPQ